MNLHDLKPPDIMLAYLRARYEGSYTFARLPNNDIEYRRASDDHAAPQYIRAESQESYAREAEGWYRDRQ